MSIDDAVATVLERLSDAQVHALATAFEPLPRPAAGIAHVVAGAPPGASDAITALTAAWAARPELTGPGIALALRTGLAARRDAHARRARPVWTGPGTVGEQRLTAAVLHELLAAAHERILLVSYAAYTLPEVAADLEAAVERGCRVDVVFETGEDSAGSYTGPERPFAQVAGISRWRWPADQREDGAVLHAKLLVIDSRRAFLGSANLTARALHRNLEERVLELGPAIASLLADRVGKAQLQRLDVEVTEQEREPVGRENLLLPRAIFDRLQTGDELRRLDVSAGAERVSAVGETAQPE